MEEILLAPREDVRYIVSHQVTDNKYRLTPEGLLREDVILSQIKGRGLSRNRNNVLKYAGGDIGLLADDDVRFTDENFAVIKEVFGNEPSLDVACFKIATPPGEGEYKDYASEPYLLNEKNGHYISSLEIAFRLDRVRWKGINFDERFGLGSNLIQYGEEAVFIHDCIKAGLRVKFVPRYVVEHSVISATKAIEDYTTPKNIFKGGYDARRYGWRALTAAIYDAVRLRGELARCNKPPLEYLNERLKGAFHILFSRDRANGEH
ncbi:MAG: hypothetical protein R6U91_02750 [Bacillota bacterium]